MSLPFSNLKWWIKGIQVPNKPTTGLLVDENKLTKEFSQDGWIIQLDDYKNINDQLLPMKIICVDKKLAHIKNTFMGILDSDKN